MRRMSMSEKVAKGLTLAASVGIGLLATAFIGTKKDPDDMIDMEADSVMDTPTEETSEVEGD